MWTNGKTAQNGHQSHGEPVTAPELPVSKSAKSTASHSATSGVGKRSAKPQSTERARVRDLLKKQKGAPQNLG